MQAYWQIGRLIVEDEQGGEKRAEYGKAVLYDLSQRLSAEFGKGFTPDNLRNFRQFFQSFSWTEICDTVCSELSCSHFRLLMQGIVALLATLGDSLSAGLDNEIDKTENLF